MSAIAAAVKHMLAAGMPHDAIVAAVEEMEAGSRTGGDAAAERRRAWDRERKRKQRSPSTGSGGTPVETGGNPQSPVDNEDVPRAPSRVEDKTKTSPKGESKGTTAVVHPLPINQAFDAWDEMAGTTGLPKIRDRTDSRVRHLRSRLSAHGMQGWLDAMAIVARSQFLTGGNQRGWRANFDFVVKAENFAKILEGSYAKPGDAAPKKPAPKAPETDAEWAHELKLARTVMEWWADRLGPPPFAPGCRVPEHLLTKRDDAYWRVREAA